MILTQWVGLGLGILLCWQQGAFSQGLTDTVVAWLVICFVTSQAMLAFWIWRLRH